MGTITDRQCSNPLSAREELVANIENIIWAQLEHQAERGRHGPYVDRCSGMVDATGTGLDISSVAAAVAELFVGSGDDCSWCHNPCAIYGWKQPLTDTADN